MGEESVVKKRSLGSAAAATAGSGRIQLLLHCVDGCVPYLNPSQLEQHFPPSETKDLWLGLAVRDSCVAPIYASAAENKQRKTKTKTKTNTDQNQSTEDSKNKNDKNNTREQKIRGYTFGALSPDPWLLPYTRFTVPSFGLQEANGKTSSTSNNAVHVWTPHGKQKLTPGLYATAALEGLQSHHTLSLFDDFGDEEFSRRRSDKAVSRNVAWFRDIASKNQSLAAASRDEAVASNNDSAASSSVYSSLLWKPVLLPHKNEEGHKPEKPSESNQNHNSTTKPVGPSPKTEGSKDGDGVEHNPSGLAFVGRWHSGIQPHELIAKHSNIPDPILESIPWKAILATYSLKEILEVASTGTINVIGTNLPQKWAKEKLALGLDLAAIGQPPPSNEPVAMDATSTASLDTQVKTNETALDQPDPKRQKTTDPSPGGAPQIAGGAAAAHANGTAALNDDGCMDLSDVSYARDPRPLVPGCGCFVCKDARFSRAYIHHLVVAKEMVAEILLFGHNLHCMLQLTRSFDSSDPSRAAAVKDFVFSKLPSVD